VSPLFKNLGLSTYDFFLIASLIVIIGFNSLTIIFAFNDAFLAKIFDLAITAKIG